MPCHDYPLSVFVARLAEDLEGFLERQPAAAAAAKRHVRPNWTIIEMVRRMETWASSLEDPDLLGTSDDLVDQCLALDDACKAILTAWGVPHALDEESGWIQAYRRNPAEYYVDPDRLALLRTIHAGLKRFLEGRTSIEAAAPAPPPPERPEERRNRYCLDLHRAGWTWGRVHQAQIDEAGPRGWVPFGSESSTKKQVRAYAEAIEDPLPENRGGRPSIAPRK